MCQQCKKNFAMIVPIKIKLLSYFALKSLEIITLCPYVFIYFIKKLSLSELDGSSYTYRKINLEFVLNSFVKNQLNPWIVSS